MPRRNWTPSEEEILRARFPYEPTAVLVRQLGRSTAAITQHAHRLGLVKETSRGLREHRRYGLDLSAILNPGQDAAYFLGMALAKGNVSGDTFRLTSDHLGVILAARRVLGSDHPIRSARNSDSLYVSIRSPELAEILGTWNITRRKITCGTWPQPPSVLLGSFTRGFFDGAGYAGYRPHGGLRVKFTKASHGILTGMAAQLSGQAGIPAPAVETDKGNPNGHRLWYYGQNAASLGRLMYQHDGFFLARKRQPFLDYEAGETSR